MAFFTHGVTFSRDKMFSKRFSWPSTLRGWSLWVIRVKYSDYEFIPKKGVSYLFSPCAQSSDGCVHKDKDPPCPTVRVCRQLPQWYRASSRRSPPRRGGDQDLILFIPTVLTRIRGSPGPRRILLSFKFFPLFARLSLPNPSPLLVDAKSHTTPNTPFIHRPNKLETKRIVLSFSPPLPIRIPPFTNCV